MELRNKKILCVGEVLWDNLPSGKKPGGAPMNVALHLHNLHQEVDFASKVGNDAAGRELVEFLKSSGVPAALVEVDDHLPTSQVLVHLDELGNATYEICAPVAWDNLQLSSSLQEAAATSGVIIFGTLASRNPVTRNTLLQLLEGDAIRLIDINLRKPFDQPDVVETLLARADIVKMNHEELETISGWHGREFRDEKDAIRWFVHRYRVKMVCVTRGSRGALLYAGEGILEHPGYRVEAIDTVGSGDAFLAGWLASLLDGKGDEEALAFACATGAFVATQQGATPAYDLAQINKIMR